MFIRTIKNNITEYIAQSGQTIQRISFDQNFFLNSLTFQGKIPTEKLNKFDRDIYGSIHISSMFVICTNTVNISSEEISEIFDILQEDVPGMKEIKAELLSMVAEAKKMLPKEPISTLTQSTSENLMKTENPGSSILGIFSPTNTKPKCYNEEDIKKMSKGFGSYSYEVNQISTLKTNQFRTTKAHYRDTNIHCYDQENVCRTTITIPSSNCSYIECRFTPDQYYGGKQEKMATIRYFIAFSSEEKANNFLELLYSNEHICNRQKKFDDDYQKAGKKVVSRYKKTLEVNHLEIDHVLDILVTSDNCIKEAVKQHNEVLNEFRSKNESSNISQQRYF